MTPATTNLAVMALDQTYVRVASAQRVLDAYNADNRHDPLRLVTSYTGHGSGARSTCQLRWPAAGDQTLVQGTPAQVVGWMLDNLA